MTYANDLEFWQSSHRLRFILETARSERTAPWAVLLSVLARVAVVTPPNVVTPAFVGSRYGSLNTFVAIVGASSDGKGLAVGTARRLIPNDLNATDTLPVSGEGLATLFARRDRLDDDVKSKRSVLRCVNMRAMLDVPEVTVLGAAMGRTGSTLLGTLTSLWSGEAIGGQNVNEAKRLRVPEYGYRVALVTGVQPGNADILMQEDVTGLPQRILWATTRDPDAPQERPHRPSGDLGFDAGKLSKLQPSEFEIDGLYQAGGYEKCRSENGNIVYPFHVIEYPAAVFEEVDADGLNRLHGARPDGMDGHSLLVTIKTAGLLAILEQRVGAALIVTEEDWQRAKYIVAKSRQTREVCVNDSRIIRRGKRCERLADDLIAKSEAKEAVNYERYARRITKALGKYDNEHEGIKGYMIQRKTGIPTSDTYQTISRMYEEGLLEKIGPEVEGTGSQLWALSSVRP
ncbi:hypothetical protein [Bifidobacterium myosotis]|nr:hypothetical protein [Bifidobacterium myosotis]